MRRHTITGERCRRSGHLPRTMRLLVAVSAAAACGGSPAAGDHTPAPAQPGQSATAALDPAVPPLAFSADPAARTVSFQLVAAHDGSNSGFNFNGYGRGRLAISVPEGWRVTVTCENAGPLNHSCAIVRGPGDSQPAIAGAASPNPVSGQAPGVSATFEFTARGQGTYRIACLVPGHEQGGMWDSFTVGPAPSQPSASIET